MLRFSQPKYGMLPYKNVSDLESINISGLSDLRSLTEDFLVDLNGNKYFLSAPSFITPPKGIMKLWGSIVGNAYQLQWQIEKRGSVETNELKAMIAAEFESNASYWLASDLELLEEKISKGNSVKKVISSFFE